MTGSSLTSFAAVLTRDLKVFWKNLRGNLLRIAVQPLFFLVVFGYILPDLGRFPPGYGDVIYPGIVAISAMNAALFGVAGPLGRSLDQDQEVRQHVLFPVRLPVLAFEKVVYGTVQAVVSGEAVALMGWFILKGPGYPVTAPLEILPVLVLTGACFASIGLVISSRVTPLDTMWEVLILTSLPMTFFGATFYPRQQLVETFPELANLVLLIPATYASEGLRGVLTPEVPHLGWAVTLPALLAWFLGFFLLGVRSFRRRIID